MAGVDTRYYVTDAMWATNPYNKFVFLKTGFSHLGSFRWQTFCSAQYIAPNLILSAGHCADNKKYIAKNYKKDEFDLVLAYTEYSDNEKLGIKDWAVWFVSDPKYYSDTFFEPEKITQQTDFINAGWGWVRILTDDEIDSIFDMLQSDVGDEATKMSLDQIANKLENSLKEKGLEPIRDNEDRLKASQCHSIGVVNCDSLEKEYEDKKTACRQISEEYIKCWREHNHDKSACEDLAKQEEACDDERFKLLNQKDECLDLYEDYPNIIAHTCTSWQGNSGGGYVSQNNDIYGVCSYGTHSDLHMQKNQGWMTSAWQFEDKIKELRETYSMSNSPKENLKKAQQFARKYRKTLKGTKSADKKLEAYSMSDVAEDTDETDEEYTEEEFQRQIETLQQEVTKEESELRKEIKEGKNLDRQRKLQILDKVVAHTKKAEQLEDLQKAYQEAKGRETSLSNRVLSAAAMGAGGIGGMMLGAGVAEQLADADAEQDMRDYIATFRCDYGKGFVANAGDVNIEIPGGNGLFDLYREYAVLANDLKIRKEAFGLRPGIESEVVIDKNTVGLYDDVGSGMSGSGTYASIARAILNPNGEDGAKWNEQKSDVSTKLQTGAIVGGVGVIGGAVGNAMINGTGGKGKNKE